MERTSDEGSRFTEISTLTPFADPSLRNQTCQSDDSQLSQTSDTNKENKFEKYWTNKIEYFCEKLTFECGLMTVSVTSAVLYICHLCMSLALVTVYKRSEDSFWMYMTISCLLFNLFIMIFYCFNWYSSEISKFNLSSDLTTKDKILVVLNLIIIFIGLGPVKHHITTIYYQKYVISGVQNLNKTRTVFISICDSYLHAMPQAMLQLYILKVKWDCTEINKWLPIAYVAVAVLSSAWSLTLWSQVQKALTTRLSFPSVFLYALVVFCRLFSVSCFSAHYYSYVFVYLIVHFAAMIGLTMFLMKDSYSSTADFKEFLSQVLKILVISWTWNFAFITWYFPKKRNLPTDMSHYKPGKAVAVGYYILFVVEVLVLIVFSTNNNVLYRDHCND